MRADASVRFVPGALRWRPKRPQAEKARESALIVDVAASIVQAPDGRVLFAERTARQISAGFWELPGGKIEAGETAHQAAERELQEEIGITPLSMRPWITYEHAFPAKRVRLRFFRVEAWKGEPRGLEGQRLAWADPASPSVTPILPSNMRVLRALGLPPIYLHMNVRHDRERKAGLAGLPALLASGVRLIQIQDRHAAPDQRIAFAQRINAKACAFGARVLLTGSATEARRAGLAGVHSTAEDLRRLSARPPVLLWAVSCRSADDLARAVSLGADFAVIGPVLQCPTHPDRSPLGWEGLRALAGSAPVPVFAGGGMTPDMLTEARRAGAAGVAADFTGSFFAGDNHGR